MAPKKSVGQQAHNRPPLQADFCDMLFGYSNSEEELTSAPDLLSDGFLDPDGHAEEARDGRRFLFLGNKGFGKSAIAGRLELNARADAMTFVRTENIKGFSHKRFNAIVAGDSEDSARFPTAWSWLLLIKVIDSLVFDQSFRTQRPADVNALRSLGLVHTGSSLAHLTQLSAKKDFRANILGLLEIGAELSRSAPEAQMSVVTQHLEDTITQSTFDGTHIIIIDGLDEALTSKQRALESTSALIGEAARLNRTFRGRGVKFVILCRSDMFDALPGPDKNKIRQDYGSEIKWYEPDPVECRLLQLVRLRARLDKPSSKDVFGEFLAPSVRGKKVTKYLLDQTRHRPRDLIQLMIRLQSRARKQPRAAGVLPGSEIEIAAKEYSEDYLVSEIEDDLRGFLPQESVKDIFPAISSIRKREFKFTDLQKALTSRKSLKDIPPEEVVDALFEASAIGNTTLPDKDGHRHYTFKFRNPKSRCNHGDPLLLHQGLWRTLNVR